MLTDKAVEELREYQSLTQELRKYKKPLFAAGLGEGAVSAVISALCKDFGKTVIIMPDEKKAHTLFSELSGSFSRPLFYPARDFAFENYDVSSKEFDAQRLGALSKILQGDYDIVVTTVEAASEATLPAERLKKASVRLTRGANINRDDLLSSLAALGYSHAEVVEGQGQFSVRGSIVDVFPLGEEYPIRLDFFGDEIDSMGKFDTLTQRRFEAVSEFSLLPAEEFAFTDSEREKVKSALAEECKKVNGERKSRIEEEIEKINKGESLPPDLYLSVLYPKITTLLDYTCEALHILTESTSLEETSEGISLRLREELEFFTLNAPGFIPKSENSFLDFPAFAEKCSESKTVIFNNFATVKNAFSLGGIFTFRTKPVTGFGGNADVMEDDLKSYLASGYAVLFAADNLATAGILAENLRDREIEAFISSNGEFYRGRVAIVARTSKESVASLPRNGFEFTDSRFVFISESAVAPARNIRKRRFSGKKDAAERIFSYTDITVGDYVVHATHGIGIYQGVKTMDFDGAKRDFLKIEYGGGDVLYLPCDNLDALSKYLGSGGEDRKIKLSRLDSLEWKKAKAKAKSAAKDVAKDLIRLYSAREKAKGYAFSKDTEWQKEFEESFEYEETPDQLRCVEEIKADMEKSHPMDRLLCGDVGFGKTEVALRAAFKAVSDGKQVALLAPTTILAWQHYSTVMSRFRSYPVRVEMLSRFRSKKEITKSIEKIKSGEADIIIGTHRLLQKDVEFKDLGLLIVDEEQRFGVSHKERLKELSVGVDVLTLSATPIPRTMNMALSGIRDMSIIEEAPFDRYPVQTYVLPFDDKIIFEAIRRELRRGGQVFYLHNNIEQLDGIAAKISNFFPDITVALAHGKMDKDRLSEIWQAMLAGDIDVLISTTIIETGIDVPNANTLIIENADHFGLSQLHQIRGRVGRSNRKAYAYLTYRPNIVPNETATKRLEAIRDFTEFGSGFRIAMRDLEIRGAGNLLGTAQSGHMNDVGYELYIKLLNEAIEEEKGLPPKPKKEETRFDVVIDAHIPVRYIESGETRIDIYRKIASLQSEEDARDLREELFDRFGKLPRSVENLITVSMLRKKASDVGVHRISEENGRAVFYLNGVVMPVLEAISAIYAPKLKMSLGKNPFISIPVNKENRVDRITDLLINMENLLKNIKEEK